nr:hypothetical protein [Pseudoalteromonas sp. T1lg88]
MLKRALIPCLFASPLCLYASEEPSLSSIERIITTASRLDINDDATTLAISAVSEQELALIAASHIEKALQGVAGANLQHGNGQEYLPALRSPVYTGAVLVPPF